MSRADVRQAIADAASTVDGITCQPNFVQTTKPGTAMVRFDHMDRSQGGVGFVNTWQVAVLLPQDYAAAEKFVDDKIPDLIEALSNEIYVMRVTPAQLAIDTGNLPVVFIDGVREEE